MARGGSREGSQGKILANAAVGAAPKVNFDGGYGDDVAQAPLQANRSTPRPPSSPTSQQGGGPSRPMIPLDAPSTRLDEPVTAGSPIGPGPGMEVLGITDGPGSMLRAIYQESQDESIRELIEALDEGR